MNRLLVAIVVSIVFAFASVLAFEGQMASVYWIGEFFLETLKMIIVPLVVFSMISGITGLGDVRRLGRLGGVTLLYFLATTAAAVVIGVVVVNLIQPGIGLDPGVLDVPERVAAREDTGLTDIVMSLVSDNIVDSMAKLELLPIIVFSLVFGAVLTTVKGNEGVVAAINVLNEVMLRIVHVIMYLAPVGIFGLVAGRFGKAVADGGLGAFYGELSAVGAYMAAVLTGLGLHAIIVLPLILWVTTGRNPLTYARGMASALLTSFSTASSAATMPLTLESVEHANQVDGKAAQFVVPLGATVNMNGTALYEAVAAIFIAQAMGVELTFGQQLLVVLTATLAAIGAAGIPEAGLVTMVIVLKAVHLPLEGVALILSVDWLLDRFRTAVNVWGDAVGAAVVERHGLDGGRLGEPARASP